MVQALTALIEGTTINGDNIEQYATPQAYPDFGGVVIWSINKDAENSNQAYNAVENYLN